MFSKKIIAVGIALLGSEFAWQIWKKWFRGQMKNTENAIAEVLLFSDKCSYCRDHANEKTICEKEYCSVGSVNKLVHYMDSTKKTIIMSMYIITCQDTVDALIRAHKRSVNVRMIVDAGMSENPACCDQINRMRRAGIRVQIHGSQASLMHHKYSVLDNKIMIFGSTNWTMQAFYGNFDSILITNERKFIEKYTIEFDRMWNDWYIKGPLPDVKEYQHKVTNSPKKSPFDEKKHSSE